MTMSCRLPLERQRGRRRIAPATCALVAILFATTTIGKPYRPVSADVVLLRMKNASLAEMGGAAASARTSGHALRRALQEIASGRAKLDERHYVLIGIASAFTLAHSLTFALAVTGVVTVPELPIEIAIASSVILAALTNIFPRAHGIGVIDSEWVWERAIS
jgi:hypothetical protein